MRILLLPAYFTPELCADTHLDDARYEAFEKAGFFMDLYTPSPTRGVSNDDKNKFADLKFETMYNGNMHVHRFNMFDEGTNTLSRAFRYFLCFIIQFYKGCFCKKPDVVFVLSTPPIQGMLAALIKIIRGCKFVYYLQDVFPDTLVSGGITKKGSIIWKIGRVIESFTYKHADCIVVISEDVKNNIIAKGVPEEKIQIIRNWVDEKFVRPILKDDNPLYDELKISKEKFHVVYAGNLGKAQNIDIIIDAAEKLQDYSNIEFLIFGSGGIEKSIREKIQALALSNIKLFPLQPYDKVPFVYSLGDCCIVSCKKGFGGTALPSKTWSILSCSRPVIANFDDGELKSILKKNNLGLFSDAGDLKSFVNSIIELYNSPIVCDEIGRRGREYILNNLTKEVGTSKFVQVIKNQIV